MVGEGCEGDQHLVHVPAARRGAINDGIEGGLQRLLAGEEAIRIARVPVWFRNDHRAPLASIVVRRGGRGKKGSGMAGLDAEVHRQLGEVIAGLKAVKESLEEHRDAARRSEEKSDISRAGVHRRMDDLVDRIGGVESDVGAVKKDVADMKPVTEDVKRWKLMGMGALAVTGVAFMAMGVTFAEAIKRLVRVMLGG